MLLVLPVCVRKVTQTSMLISLCDASNGIGSRIMGALPQQFLVKVDHHSLKCLDEGIASSAGRPD